MTGYRDRCQMAGLLRNRAVLDRLFIFLCVLAVMSVVSLGALKIMLLAASAAYIFWTRKIRMPANIMLLLLLLLVQLLVHLGSAHIDAIVTAGIQVFLFRLIVYVLLYNLMFRADTQESSRLVIWTAVCFVCNVLVILLLYVPGLLAAADIRTYRLDGRGYRHLYFYSANLLAYMIFAAHVLLLFISSQIGQMVELPASGQRLSTCLLKHPNLCTLPLHLILFGFALLTRSRGYYVLVLMFLAFLLLDRFFRSKLSRRCKLTLLASGLTFIVTMVILILVIRQQEHLVKALLDLQTPRPAGVAGRFISLGKIILTRDRIIDASTLERMNLIRYAWLLFLQRPLFGHGLGTFRDLVANAPFHGIVAICNNTHTHVELFELLAGTGLLGMLLYYASFRPVLSYRKNDRLLFGLLLVSILAGFIFRIYYDKLIWWILVVLNHVYKAEERVS